MTSASATRVLLLVEDEPADADHVEELLEGSDVPFEVVRAQSRAEAVQTLGQRPTDIILLDLELPDDAGLSTLHAVLQAAPETPTVVITGSEDEQLALTAVAAGAHDYLRKDELERASLRRTLSFAITRTQESQIRDLRETLEKLGSLTSNAERALASAARAGALPVQSREPFLFESLAADYKSLLYSHLERNRVAVSQSRELMEHIAIALGDASAGPRDLIDVHVAALNAAVTGENSARSRTLAMEGRLTALEMMGLLVDYYRIGLRRRESQR